MALALDCISGFHFISKSGEMGGAGHNCNKEGATYTYNRRRETKKKLLLATVCSFLRDPRSNSHKPLLDWGCVRWAVLERRPRAWVQSVHNHAAISPLTGPREYLPLLSH